MPSGPPTFVQVLLVGTVAQASPHVVAPVETVSSYHLHGSTALCQPIDDGLHTHGHPYPIPRILCGLCDRRLWIRTRPQHGSGIHHETAYQAKPEDVLVPGVLR